MKRFLRPGLFLLILTFLTGCSAIIIEETEAAHVRTDILPHEVVIENAQMLPGKEYAIEAVYHQPPETRYFVRLHDIPKADRVFAARLEKTGSDHSEWLVVQVYLDSDRANTTYEKLSSFAELNPPEPLDLGFGEAVIVRRTVDDQAWQTVIFKNCDVVVFADTTTDSVNYASKVNAQIVSEFCGK